MIEFNIIAKEVDGVLRIDRSLNEDAIYSKRESEFRSKLWMLVEELFREENLNNCKIKKK